MSVQILKAQDQEREVLPGGDVRARKPVCVESEIKGISNLFYVATLWSPEGGLLETSSRKGFEVISYIIEGEVKHTSSVDDEVQVWKKGDWNVMRTAGGISNTEEFSKGARILQIWFDPDFRTSLQRSATSVHYEEGDIEWEERNGTILKDVCGDDSPIWFSTEADIKLYSFSKGKFEVDLKKGEFVSGTVLDGEIKMNNNSLEKEDFFTVRNEKKLTFSSTRKGMMLLVTNPVEPGYKTYSMQLQIAE